MCTQMVQEVANTCKQSAQCCVGDSLGGPLLDMFGFIPNLVQTCMGLYMCVEMA